MAVLRTSGSVVHTVGSRSGLRFYTWHGRGERGIAMVFLVASMKPVRTLCVASLLVVESACGNSASSVAPSPPPGAHTVSPAPPSLGDYTASGTVQEPDGPPIASVR